MQEKINRITSLIEKFLEENLTQEEEKELNAWLAEAEHNRLFFQQITNKEILREKLKLYAGTNSESIWHKTLQKIDGGKLINLYPEKKTFRIPYGKVAAAAAVILLISAGTWYYFGQTSKKQIAKTENNAVISVKSIIVPGGKKAVLTLADGSNISLSDVQNGELAQQGQIQITKTDGRLIYNKEPNSGGPQNGQDLYNTVTTPKGGEYQITLPDGSKVWLNAASSLRFPIAFAGNERIVELTGEAYFEVNPQNQKLNKQNTSEQTAKAAKTPFIVKINTPKGNRNEVEVLGTHFNVMAYGEETAIKTTLVEGAVKVTSGNYTETIKPGQQARSNEGAITVKKVDAESVVAWTNGYIPVGGSDLEYTMNQIARWYDVNVVYEGKKPEMSFEGKLPRTASISDVIQLLNANNIKARLNEKERKIIITS
jgi:ferric-dicitrate binding protein FerR (iron transport regulator)